MFSGVNTLWTVLINEPVINEIKTLNKRTKADVILRFDFMNSLY